ncbi:hypothetical protein IWQ54_006630 [Labrenzia sp. EL_195]|nr:hypothetical protein [Labrenzia sp. EL_195]
MITLIINAHQWLAVHKQNSRVPFTPRRKPASNKPIID